MRRSLPPLLCHDLGRRVFSGLARVLRPWAYLRLGGVESVAGRSVAFRLPSGERGFPVSPDKRETRCRDGEAAQPAKRQLFETQDCFTLRPLRQAASFQGLPAGTRSSAG